MRQKRNLVDLQEPDVRVSLFVSAGWPAAQALTFRLAEIWR